MNSLQLILTIAIVSIWFSLVCGLVAIYFLLSGKTDGPKLRFFKRSQHVSTPPSTEAATEDVPVLVDKEAQAWELFVMFDEPTMASNEHLSIVLSSAGTVYENASQSFTLAGDSPRNPIYITNAYPPGKLPSFNNDNGQYPVKGVTVKMVKKSRSATPNKLQLVRLVKLSKELARIGGKVVDANHQPITQSGFQAVINGRAKV